MLGNHFLNIGIFIDSPPCKLLLLNPTTTFCGSVGSQKNNILPVRLKTSELNST